MATIGSVQDKIRGANEIGSFDFSGALKVHDGWEGTWWHSAYGFSGRFRITAWKGVHGVLSFRTN